MLSDFQQRIYDLICASGLLEHEQASLNGGKIRFPSHYGLIEVHIPASVQEYAYTRASNPNAALTEHDVRRAAAIASALADARDGKPIRRFVEEVAL